MNRSPRLIVAMDYDSLSSVKTLCARLEPSECRLKIGKELFTAVGPAAIEYAQSQGFEVFLDLKFHDIPQTVGKACAAAANLGVWMLNVHASGGEKMMVYAREAIDNCRHSPILIGVTVLTSMGQNDLSEIGVERSIEQQVDALASLAKKSGLDGVVCSAHESARLRASQGDDFTLVTPGIRPHGASADDQRRIVAPAEAIINGSSYLVIGRPITQAENPQRVVEQINREIQLTLSAG